MKLKFASIFVKLPVIKVYRGANDGVSKESFEELRKMVQRIERKVYRDQAAEDEVSKDEDVRAALVGSVEGQEKHDTHSPLWG